MKKGFTIPVNFIAGLGIFGAGLCAESVIDKALAKVDDGKGFTNAIGRVATQWLTRAAFTGAAIKVMDDDSLNIEIGCKKAGKREKGKTSMDDDSHDQKASDVNIDWEECALMMHVCELYTGGHITCRVLNEILNNGFDETSKKIVEQYIRKEITPYTAGETLASHVLKHINKE